MLRQYDLLEHVKQDKNLIILLITENQLAIIKLYFLSKERLQFAAFITRLVRHPEKKQN